MTAAPAYCAWPQSDPHAYDLRDEASALRSVAASAEHRRRTVAVVAATVSNADEIVAGRGAAALEAVVHELVDRATTPALDAQLLSVSDLGVVAALVVPADRTVEAAREFADRLSGLVRVGSHRLWPVVTAGAVLHRRWDSPETALHDVRTAMLAAARTAPGTVRWHAAPLSPGTELDRLDLVPDLASALYDETHQVDLAYQPVCDLVSGDSVGAEALIRWTHPHHGPISAQLMVRLAEENGLVRRLGSLVLDRALAVTAEVRRRAGGPFLMHVNVSPIELRDPRYVEGVRAALARHDVPPSMLLLELTETALMSADVDVVPVLAELRAVGVRIGIDDFGTGYSSIARLHRLPVDTVKVDRSLISGIATSPEEFDLVSAVFRLLSTTGVRVVAEGVETAVQVAHLRAVGCRLAQGLLLGAPGPADALV